MLRADAHSTDTQQQAPQPLPVMTAGDALIGLIKSTVPPGVEPAEVRLELDTAGVFETPNTSMIGVCAWPGRGVAGLGDGACGKGDAAIAACACAWELNERHNLILAPKYRKQLLISLQIETNEWRCKGMKYEAYASRRKQQI